MKIRLFVMLACLLIGGNCWAAAITSAQSGNSSASATWVGGVKPGAGDTAIVATGHTVTFDENTTVGATSGTVHGLEIRATDATTYGKVVVNSGVTLTLQGVDRAKYAMYIKRYAVFEPLPGSRIEVNNVSDCSTGILNEGIINAIGTAESPIVFSIPPANRNWDVTVTNEARSGVWSWDELRSIAFDNVERRLSNAAGTGLGSRGDSSVTFSGVSPATILQTEVDTIDEVNAVGKYHVDYNVGVIYFYHNYADGAPVFNVSYKYLDRATANWKGWFIDAGYVGNDVTYNEMKFDKCLFEYMGAMGGTLMPALRVGFKKTPSVEANRQFYVKNSTFRWGGASIWFRWICTGTAADPILIDNNQFLGNYSTGGADVGSDGIALAQTNNNNHSYITISNNYVNQPLFIESGSSNTPGGGAQLTGIKIINNTGKSIGEFVRDFKPPTNAFVDGEFSGNVLYGMGYFGASDTRAFLDVRGISGHPLIIKNNVIKNFRGALYLNRYVRAFNNLIWNPFYAAVHVGSGFTGHAHDVEIYNNLIYMKSSTNVIGQPAYGSSMGQGVFALYLQNVGNRIWIDRWRIHHNTVVVLGERDTTPLLALGNVLGGGHTSLITDTRFTNNIMYGGKYGIQRAADSTTQVVKSAIHLDYNLFYNQITGLYSGINKSATFVKSGQNYSNMTTGRNVTGVSLWNPDYATAQTGGTLTYTVNTADVDATVQWNSGTPVQLVQHTGTLSANAGLYNTTYDTAGQGITITDSSKTFSTTTNNAACPQGRFLKITSGAASGYVGGIILNTATVLSVVPLPSAMPAAGDSYTIYESEIVLDDGAGGHVGAMCDRRSMPAETAIDTGIDIAFNTPNANPLIANTATNYPVALDFKITANSPAIGAATTETDVTTDYAGVLRVLPDIGAYEYVAPATSTPVRRGVFWSNGSFGFQF